MIADKLVEMARAGDSEAIKELAARLRCKKGHNSMKPMPGGQLVRTG